MKRAASRIATALLALAVAGLPVGPAVADAKPQESSTAVDPEADRILRAMSGYLGNQRAFTADFDVDSEIIDSDGQKLQFSSSGSIEVQRPGRLHATRRGGFVDAEVFFDGRTVTLLGKNQNVYMQVSGPATIDAAIDALRSQTDLDVAGADLIYAAPYDGLLTDVRSGRYLGPAVVNGIACDHLAFRAAKVDWEIWVQRGDKPLPLKYVITSKWISGSPQYAIRLRNWNLQPQLNARTFEFTPPPGARRVEVVATNELGEPAAGGER